MIHRQIVTAACAMWLFVGASAAGAQVQVSTGELGPGILPSQALVRPALADITGGKSISAGDFVQRLNRLQYGKELPPATASSLTTEAFVKRNGAGLWENYPPKSGLIANLPLNTRVGW